MLDVKKTARNVIGAAVASVMAFSAATAKAQQLDEVVYGTASRVGLANAAIYLAEVIGFSVEEGINIRTVQFDGTGVLMPQLASKAVTIGYPIPDSRHHLP